jgi:hypothetical protein
MAVSKDLAGNRSGQPVALFGGPRVNVVVK